ncbi:fimbrial chaperone protein [Enterobacterales bacterium CwR94]|nr:fimbrial chaperone protein [Enterobacterales bacterium CwR94]
MIAFAHFILALCLLISGNVLAQQQEPPPSGISFYVLRVIYSAEERQGAALTVYNKSNTPVLMQSWIRPVDSATGDVETGWQGVPAMPFILTPPLTRLEANSDITLRIRRNGVPLPQDRESVFYISMKTLPPQKTTGDQMVMTVVSNMKVFYRPQGLVKRAVAKMAPKLHFHRQHDQLTAINPTPYWLTFSRLSVGGSPLEKPALRLMVPPYGQQSYRIPASATGTVSWQLIDEDGWDTPVAQQSE